VSAAPEMVVSVGPGRILKALMDDFHGLGPALNRLSGATTLMAAVADYRETQRTQGWLGLSVEKGRRHSNIDIS